MGGLLDDMQLVATATNIRVFLHSGKHLHSCA